MSGDWREHGLEPVGIAARLSALGVKTLGDAALWIEWLPYRRTKATCFEAVIGERCGTCSTKHALLVALGREQGVDARLVVGLFEMSDAHFPVLAPVLEEGGFPSILEAHCVARIDGETVDFTGLADGRASIQFLAECEFDPDTIGNKVAFHRAELAHWASEKHPGADFESLWDLRERCISALSAADS